MKAPQRRLDEALRLPPAISIGAVVAIRTDFDRFRTIPAVSQRSCSAEWCGDAAGVPSTQGDGGLFVH
jgi:hypothetical protein